MPPDIRNAAQELVLRLDRYAKDIDHHEYGLPVYHETYGEELITIVMLWLQTNKEAVCTHLTDIPGA